MDTAAEIAAFEALKPRLAHAAGRHSCEDSLLIGAIGLDLEQADRSLSEAKTRGRNRVVLDKEVAA